MADHAYLPPSSAHVWSKCGRWAEYNRTNPHGLDGDSESSAEGTAAHWALAEMLAGRDVAAGLIAPNGVPLDDEMVECAEFAHDEIAKLIEPGVPYESEVRLPPGGSLGPDVWGTPDLRQIGSRRVLKVDYKYGHGYVDVLDNMQLVTYDTLTLDQIAASKGVTRGAIDEHVMFENVIVQPRYYGAAPVRSWSVRGSDLRGHINKLELAAHTAGPDAPAVSGEHCKHCSGRLACSAFMADLAGCLSVTSQAVPVDLPVSAKAVQLTIMRRALTMIKSADDALSTHLTALAQTGADVPGYAVKQTAGRKVWAKPDDDILALGAALGLDLSKPKLVTPAQAVKAGMPAELLDSFTERKAGSLSLEPIDMRQVAAIFKE